MRGIMQQVGYEGTLQEFFAYVNNDDSQFYADSDQGRAEYVAEAIRIVEAMRAKLDQLFINKPYA